MELGSTLRVALRRCPSACSLVGMWKCSSYTLNLSRSATFLTFLLLLFCAVHALCLQDGKLRIFQKIVMPGHTVEGNWRHGHYGTMSSKVFVLILFRRAPDPSFWMLRWLRLRVFISGSALIQILRALAQIVDCCVCLKLGLQRTTNV